MIITQQQIILFTSSIKVSQMTIIIIIILFYYQLDRNLVELIVRTFIKFLWTLNDIIINNDKLFIFPFFAQILLIYYNHFLKSFFAQTLDYRIYSITYNTCHIQLFFNIIELFCHFCGKILRNVDRNQKSHANV